MAKSSSIKAGKPSKAKGKRKGRGPRQIDPWKGPPFDFRRPIGDPQTELEFGQAVAAGKCPDPNKGILSAKAFGDAHRALVAAVQDGEYGAPLPPLYSMIRRSIALQRRAICVIAGQPDKGKGPARLHRKKVKGVELSKKFNLGDKDRIAADKEGNPIPLRCCHKMDVRDLVTDREQNVLTVGSYDFVVGTTETPAAMLISGSKTGNYGANLLAGKALSFEGLGSKIRNLVARVNNGWEIVTLDTATDPGLPYPVGPNMLIDEWGHLERGGKVLTPAQIRKAVGDGDTKGIKFVALSEPIVGHSISKSKLWQAVKRQMQLAATKRTDADGNATTAFERFSARPTRSGEDASAMHDKAIHNLFQVQTRTAPDENYPFGVFNLQTCIVPVTHFGDTTDEQLVRFVIGCHIGSDYSETKWEANYRLHPEQYEDAETEAAEAPAPKAEKKTKKAKKEKKAAKKAAKKVTQPADEAAPVTAEAPAEPEPTEAEEPAASPTE